MRVGDAGIRMKKGEKNAEDVGHSIRVDKGMQGCRGTSKARRLLDPL